MALLFHKEIVLLIWVLFDAYFDIEVDGNINDQTIIPCYTSGANVFVSGGYIFGDDNPEQRIIKLKNALCNGRIG